MVSYISSQTSGPQPQRRTAFPASTPGPFEPATRQFVTITRGIDQVTIIISSSFNSLVQKIFKDEPFVRQIDDLASITCKLYDYVIFVPGIFYTILKLLAWENINVIEVVSTYTEFTIILERGQIDQSFSILMKYFHPK